MNVGSRVLFVGKMESYFFHIKTSKQNPYEGTYFKTASTDISLFFLNIFFSLHIQEKPSMSKQEIVCRNMPFRFFFFFSTLFRKDIVVWNNAMSPKSNIFPNQNAPSHKKIQDMKTKQNESNKG